ncbi:MAG: hypothetical protein LBG59_02965 [Candidatus Peribacteria bacterium]|jgi:hypothetical protein|nr:hypothetical protein [Candidatus Peribacteria bacterium]
MKNTLDPKALHQAGVILTATLTGLGVNAVWNKDKLKGIETEMEMIKKDLQGIIGEMIPTS